MNVFDEFVPKKIKNFNMQEQVFLSPRFPKVPRIYNMDTLLRKHFFILMDEFSICKNKYSFPRKVPRIKDGFIK